MTESTIGKLFLVGGTVAVLMVSCSLLSSRGPKSDPEVTAKLIALRKAEDEALAEKLNADCKDRAEALRAEYAAHMAAREFSQAASKLRPCANALDADVDKLVSQADMQDMLVTARNTKASIPERESAISAIERDHGDEFKAMKLAPLRDQILRAREAERKREEQARKREAAALARLKRSQGVNIGMTQEDVIASSWGRPEKVNRTTNARGTREQWVYGSGNYLYFEDGILVSIQN